MGQVRYVDAMPSISTATAPRTARTWAAGRTNGPSLTSLVPTDWRSALASEVASPSFAALDAMLEKESADGHAVFPPRKQIFSALDFTRLASVKVVIIGQDPYPTMGNANGLAFSVNPGMKVPASLKNIFAGLAADLGTPTPSSGDLSPWAKRGVLLLNTVLTVRKGAPNSHRGRGWEPFTEGVLKKVNEQPGPVVFLCFGVQAKAMALRLVDTGKHTVLLAPHPSPLNGKAFVRAVAADRLFTHCNEVLSRGGRSAIEWSLP